MTNALEQFKEWYETQHRQENQLVLRELQAMNANMSAELEKHTAKLEAISQWQTNHQHYDELQHDKILKAIVTAKDTSGGNSSRIDQLHEDLRGSRWFMKWNNYRYRKPLKWILSIILVFALIRLVPWELWFFEVIKATTKIDIPAMLGRLGG